MAKRYLGVAALAVAYYVAGKIGLQLASPSGFAAPVWPPAGIALAAVLIFGRRLWPGVLLGAFLVNFDACFAPSPGPPLNRAIAVGLAIAGGVALQAVVGASLLRRVVGYPNALVNERDVIRFFLIGGPVSCLIAATCGVGSLVLGGIASAEQFATQWWTWWLGDVIGVLIFAPLVLILFGAPRKMWRARLLPVGIPLCLTFAAALVVFIYAITQEKKRLHLEFDQQAAALAQRIDDTLQDYLEVVNSIESFYESSNKVTRGEFHTFSKHFLSRHAGIQALEWIPRVSHEDRQQMEMQAQHEGFAEFAITERDEKGRLIPAKRRAEYFPVYFVEPYATYERALGFDLASNATRRKALIRARNSAGTVASAPLTLVQQATEGAGFLVVKSVYRKGAARDTRQQRRRNLKGFVLAVLCVEDIVRMALAPSEWRSMELCIIDEDVNPHVKVIYLGRGGEAVALGGDEADHVAGHAAGPQWTTDCEVGGRRWRLSLTATQAYLAAARTWHSWLVFAGGLAFTGMVGTFLLIQTGRAAELKDSEARFQDLYDNAPDMCATVDTATWRIVQCNQTLLDATGFAREEIIGRQTCTVYDPDCLDEVSEAFTSYVKSGDVRDTELQLLRKDGARIHVSLNVSAVRGADGKIAFIRCIWRDITDRKRAEEQIRQQQTELAHVSRLITMGEMAAGLAHEINQPLAAIAAFAKGAALRLESGNFDTKEIAQVVNRISADAHRAGDVIRRLRRFVHKRDPQHSALDMNELVLDVVQFIASDALHEEITVELNLADDLPLVSGDAVEFQQVVLNLIRNGFDAMADIEPPHRVLSIETIMSAGNTVEVVVRDAGPGIKSDNSQQVFEAFFSSKSDGLGMGLAISRSLVESHGGRIWLCRSLPAGLNFVSLFPSRAEPLSMSETATVYLVDDDPSVRDALQWLVESVGLQVEAYASASDLLDAFDPTKPGCLVADIRMPAMSGLDLQEAMRSQHVEIPVIFITGHGDVPLCVRAFEGGAFAFIEKPIDDQLLLDHIHKAIAKDMQFRRQQQGDPEMTARLATLTPREREVMQMLVAGRSMKQIATELGISIQTASKHRAKVLEKMQVDNDVELVRVMLTMQPT